MEAYVALNLSFLAGICVIMFIAGITSLPRTILPALGILLLLTAVFDSLIIASGIVAYDEAKLLGIFIGKAPIEDFAYTIAAVVLAPILWKRFTS